MNSEPTHEQVRQIIKKHLDVDIIDVARITEGYTHYMYDVTCDVSGQKKNFVVRISYNKKDTSDLAKELAVMEECGKHGIPIPIIYAFDIQKTDYPFDYMIMEKLKGVPLKTLLDTLPVKEKTLIAEKVGELLANIHSITLGDFGDFTKNGIKIKEEFSFRKSVDAPKIHAWTRKMLEDIFIDLSGLVTLDIINAGECSKIIDYMQKNKSLLLTAEPVLIHNDFHADHIIIDKIDGEWVISGIVDFEFACSYAREFDFIKLHRTGLLDDVHFREGLMRGYGKENLHPKFDDVVTYYRLIRDVGFAYALAKAGNMQLMRQVIVGIMKVVE